MAAQATSPAGSCASTASTAWWAQSITVGFEQARGIRRPGQRQDGTYEASVSRTVSLDTADALRALAAIVTVQLDVDPLALNLTAKYPTARFPLDGGEFVLATVEPARRREVVDRARPGVACPTGRGSPM